MTTPCPPPAPRLISRLSEILDGYDAIFCDVWGVIHNGRESFPAACDALSRAQSERGIPVVLVSNAPRPAEDVKPQLHALMVPDHAWCGFVTSGDATRAELRRRAPGPVWTIGPPRDEPLYNGLGLDRGTVETAAFICATGLFDDERETPEDYRTALGIAAARGLSLVCANPDRVVQRGDRMIYCAGALADLYQSLGGQTVMAGKPYAPIYELALEDVAVRLGRPVDRRRILAIGDGLITDVTGAQDQGIDCLFVTDGIHAADVRSADGQVCPDRISALLQAQGLVAAHATPHLVW
jgi:HAD superfamily hydrolase (TIGR01459 family)